MRLNRDHDEDEEHRKERGVDQRTGRNAPKVSARTRWRFDERDSAERPQNDLICLAARLPTSERVAEFMEQHDHEKRDVLGRSPDWIVITGREAHDLQRRDNEPGKMQIDANPCDLK